MAQLPHAASTSDALLGPRAGRAPGTGRRGRCDGVVDLTCAAPVAPAGVTAAYEQAVAQLPCHLSEHRLLPLRAARAARGAIADRYAERGLPTDPEQVLVTAGALSGLAIVRRRASSTRATGC